ncbi:AAA family ATPase [Devosia salina]|uniref:AAA family ATPase n=1 Tax=Devosia salina TaxID=2860336 RepID=A0ABX8WM37_9HYPH|nr:AAA family ATPase [Devosia salina]QYO77752.1 AAA family ATPase [Devosia salina]
MPKSKQTQDPQSPLLPDPEIRVRAIADRFCTAMLKAALPGSLVAALTANRPVVVILEAPGADWVDYLEEHLREVYPQALVVARHESAGRGLAGWTSSSLMPFLHSRSVIGVSQDPEGLLPSLLLDTADHKPDLARPDYAMVRDCIIDLTTCMPRALKAEHLAGLDAGQLLAALRPAASAGAMAKRLAAIAKRQSGAQNVPDAPHIDTLCVPDNVSDWARRVVTDLPQGKTAGLEHVLLEGPPGTGKTLLAHSLAASAGLPLVMTNAANWLQTGKGHLSDVLSAQASFFAELHRLAPAIGVIDELDSVPNRQDLRGEYDPWWVSLTNSLLTGIDQMVASGKPVLLIGITNHVQRLDPALIRAGRLGQHLTLPPPHSGSQRLSMLKLHLPEALQKADLTHLLPFLGTQTQAELKQLAVLATAEATKENKSPALEHLLAVLVPPDTRPTELRRAVALHEAGHAVMALYLGRPVHSVSILPGAGHEGETDIAEPPAGIITAGVLEDNVRILLAGRAADMLAGRGANTGARSDIARAAELIHDACFELFLYGPTRQWAGQGAEFKDRRRLVEERLGRLLDETIAILTPLRLALEAVTEALLAKPVLTGTELTALLEPHDLGGSSSAEPNNPTDPSTP